MRHPLVMGNWKLNGSRHMVHELVSNLRKELAGVAGCAVAIAPPEMYIDMAKREAEGSHIMLGAQNVDLNLSGAFTGGNLCCYAERHRRTVHHHRPL